MDNITRTLRNAETWVRICAALVLCLASVTLFGWIAGLPSLTHLGWSAVAMAPSTGVLLGLCSVAVLQGLRAELSGRAVRAGWIIGIAVALAAFVLLILSSLGIQSDLEHIGIAIQDVPDAPAQGHMSALTALGLLLFCTSYLALLRSAATRRGWATVARWLAGLLTASSISFILAYLYGMPFLSGGAFIPPATTTCLALLALGLALLGIGVVRSRPFRSDPEHGTRGAYVLAIVFALMAAGIVTAGFLYFRRVERDYRAEVERQLCAIANLKVDDLVQWRGERLGDAEAFCKNPVFSDLVQRFLDTSDHTEVEGQIRAWLVQAQEAHRYERIYFVDSQGVPRISVPDAAGPVEPYLAEQAAEFLQEREVVMMDFHRPAANLPIRLGVVAPLFGCIKGGPPLGALVLCIDPQLYLYPMISRWPVPSETAETLLVRREGGEVVFLNELRFKKDAALNLRFPLQEAEMPAVKAVLGQESIVEGLDYRGEPVLACLRSVPESPWFLVARMDKSEIFAPLRQRLWVLIGFVCLLLLTAAAILGFVWRRQSALQYRERFEATEALRRSAQNYQHLYESMMDAYVSCDMAGHIVEFNPAFQAMLGYSDDELFRLTYQELTPERWHAAEAQIVAGQILPTGHSAVYEKEYRHRSGTIFPVELRTFLLRDAAGNPSGMWAIVRDITERKRGEEALRASEGKFRSFFEHMASACSFDEMIYESGNAVDYRILDVNPSYERITGISRSEAVGALASQLYGSEIPFFDVYARVATTGEPAHFEEYFAPIGKYLEVTASCPERGRFSTIFSDVTERRENQEALAASEARLRRLLDESPYPLVVTDFARGVVLYINQPGADLFEVDKESIVGADTRCFYSDTGSRDRMIGVLRRDGMIRNREVTMCTGHGRSFHAHISVNISQYEGIEAALIAVTDITERKLAEEALRESEERFSMALEVGNAGVWEWDRQADVVHFDERFHAILGYAPGELPNTLGEWLLHHNPEEVPVWTAKVEAYLRGETAFYESEHRIRTKAGDWAWIFTRGKTVRSSATGGAERLIGIAMDVTERRRAAEQIRFQNAVLTTQQETSLDGILVVDYDGRIVSHNQRFVDMMGIPAEALQSNDDEPLLQHVAHQMADPEAFLARVRYLYGHPMEKSHEELNLADGRVFERYSTAMSTPDGENYGRVWYFRDITDRKRADQETRRLNRALRILSECNEALVRAVDETELLQHVCDLIKDIGGYGLVWVGFAETGECKDVRPAAWSARIPGYVEGIRVRWDGSPLGQGPTGVAMRTGRPVFVRDTRTDPAFAPWRNPALSYGYLSMISLPLLEPERPLGALMIYAEQVDAFDDDEVRLLLEMASDLAYGIVALRTRAEHERAEANLAASEERYRTLFDDASEGIALADAETGVLLGCNHALAKLTGYSPGDLVGKPHSILHSAKDVRDGVAASFDRHRTDQQGTVIPTELVTRSGEILQVEIKANVIKVAGRRVVQAFFRDVTEELRRHYERETTVKLLRFLNEQSNVRELVHGLTELLHEWSGCEAVGVRLREGYDFPYFETRGFSAEFVEMENYLCDRDATGAIVRDEHGDPKLECMCGNILCGRVDPSKSFFTVNGSFWSNCTTDLLATTSDADRQARTRNRCNGYGYESVALIPLRSGGQILGLVQLNDHAKGKFTASLLGFLENAADQFAIALAQRQAQKALHESEEHYRSLFANMMNGFAYCRMLFDEQGRPNDFVYVEVNAAFERLTGLKDAVGKRVSEAIPGIRETDPELIESYGRVVRTGVPARFERWVEALQMWFSVLAYRPEEGYFVSIFDVITERKRAEVQLRKLSAAVMQSPAVVVITDLNGVIEYVNPRFTESTGYTAEEAVGLTPRILKSGETSQADYAALWKAITSGGEWRGELHNRKKDGSLYWERVFIGPIRDSAGTMTHFIALKEDITQQKLLEAQYRQAQRMEAIGQLAGGVAHDFNNVLQAMVGYGAMLVDRLPEKDATHEYAEEIVHAAERAATLTRQLLAFGRRQVLEMEDLDLSEVIQSMMKMIRRVIGEDVEVSAMEHGPLASVHADRGQMEQVLLNLCVNARDAMPCGGTLFIETENVAIDEEYCSAHAWAAPGKYVLLSVTDTGCGMDAETQSRIFEPFFTTKELGKGTGLGLATVYGIVNQHQGMIHVYSELGKGSTFRVYLPSSVNAAQAPEPVALERPAGGAETILVAEDDAALRKITARILEAAGYRVLLAADGQEALDAFLQYADEIAMVVLDVIMPRMSGKAVYDTLHEQYPRVRFLFSSGYSANAIHTNFVLKEGIELIRKPYAPNALLGKVRELLDQADAGPAFESTQG